MTALAEKKHGKEPHPALRGAVPRRARPKTTACSDRDGSEAPAIQVS